MIKRLAEQNSQMKYSVTCIIMQKAAGGVHMNTQCYWEVNKDWSLTVEWKRNSTMNVFLNIYGITL
jgi:hypothetical protein